MTVSSIEYSGFGNPEHLYYGSDSAQVVPSFYTGQWQIRQVGVGGASTLGGASSVLKALADPPTAMVTAAAKVLTSSVVTSNDKTRFFPAS